MRFFLCTILLFFLLGCNASLNNKNDKTKSTSLHFDGLDDHLIVPNYEKLRINNGTIEAWFKITRKDGFDWHAIVAKELAYQLALFQYKLTGYDWKFEGRNSVGDTIPINIWHHVALVFRDSLEQGSQLYLDGKPIGKPFRTNIVNQGSELYIGSNRFNPQYFCGNIDEVRIWETIRSPEEILANYNTEIDPSNRGLVLYYKFNDAIAAGDNREQLFVQDETHNGYNGTLYQFAMQGKTSNYINDSPLQPKYFFSGKTLVLKNLWLIVSIITVIVFSFFIVKFRTRLLVRENRKLDNLVAEKTKDLNYSLKQKEVLIQEIHHRVKNNLQFIISLIEFERVKSDSQDSGRDMLQNISRRLTAIVLVHEMLYTQDNIETVSATDYITEVVQTLKNIADIDSNSIEIKLKITDCNLTINQSTAVGIITSEVIINCIKHAFAGIDKPAIKVELSIEEGMAEYSICDNGIGMHYDETEQNATGVGKKLIDVFCRQLQGTYYYKNDSGVHFNLSFPLTPNNN